MAIILHFETLRADQIGFGFSPAQEAMASLHVLSDSSHHPLHIPWVLQTRKQLSPTLKAALETFQVLYQVRIVSYPELWVGCNVLAFDEELAALLNAPIEAYVGEFARALLDEGITLEDLQQDSILQGQFRDAAAKQFPQSIAAVEELLNNPVRSRQHFCDFLTAYWESCLASEWPRLEDAFYQDIERRGHTLLQRGVLGLLSTLSPELYINFQTGHGTRKGQVEAAIHFGDEETLFLAPSYFVWPHVLTTLSHPVHLKYAIQEHWSEGQAPIPPERLLKLMRATADMTRLQILQLISQQARSTRELAGIIGISEAAISKQLRVLQEVELIRPRRDSYYVFYHLNPDRLTDLTHGVMQLIRTDDKFTLQSQ